MLTPELGSVSAVVFDFDGVFSDSRRLHDRARAVAFARRAEETGDDRYVTVPAEVHEASHLHGSTPNAIIGWVLQQVHLVDSDVDVDTNPVIMATVAHKREVYKELARSGGIIVPGMPEVVRRLMPYLPGRLAIATTAERGCEVMPYLMSQGLNRYFPDRLIVAKEDVDAVGGKPKPDPLVYEMAVERLGLTTVPETVLAIEDSLRGIESANRAGLRVGALATTHTVEELQQADGIQRPAFIARNPEHLSAILGIG